MTETTTDGAFAALDAHRFLNLTTFRRDGTPVTSPLWFVRDGEWLYLTTFADSGKVKRLRANGRAEVAPSDMRGTALGPAIPARGRFVEDREEAARARTLFRRRYGWQFRLLGPLFGLVSRRQGGDSARIYLILTPD